MKNVFTKSDGFKSEYSCGVVRVGELTPIEGSDFLAKTNVFGTQIVVRRDMVSEGDIMIYASNETQLNERFLSVNNLFEIGERDRNANRDEVNGIMAQYEPIKNTANEMKENAKRLKGVISSTSRNIEKQRKNISKINNKLKESCEDRDEMVARKEELEKKVAELEASLTAKNNELAKLVADKDKLISDNQYIVEKAKKLCGFFNKYGRVKMITLKGEPSFGFLFAPESLFAFDPSITKEDVENAIGEEFDTINGELFVKVYVPYVKEPTPRNNMKNENKRLKKFNRLVDGEFTFHYETAQLQKAIERIKPTDIVDITPKVHGTSCIIGRVLVKQPHHLTIANIFNKLISIFRLPQTWKMKGYDLVYGPIYSSRKIIRNKYVNPNVIDEVYYNSDIWSEYGDIIYPYLEEGMTVYGEIVGYVSNGQKMIQKNFDYGCGEGENKVMFYRITSTNEENGRKVEWEIPQIKEWTEKLIDRMKESQNENYRRIMPIPILYHGTLADLYDVNEEQHWHENVLELMKKDKETLGMEELEPLCKKQVPREGVVLRIENDPIAEAFKLKCTRFLGEESKLMDEIANGNEEVDVEMAEGYDV